MSSKIREGGDKGNRDNEQARLTEVSWTAAPRERQCRARENGKRKRAQRAGGKKGTLRSDQKLVMPIDANMLSSRSKEAA